MGLKKTTEQFISELKEIFYDKPFSFDKVVYNGARNYVTVTCEIHGDWDAIATNLQQGKGCRGCRTDKVAKSRRKDTQYFIQRSKKVHGERYDYSNVVYKNNTQDVAIICKEHGVFYQQPIAHYSGSGCTKCIQRVVKTLADVKQHLNKELVKNWTFVGLKETSEVNMTTKVKVYCSAHKESFNTNFGSLSKRKTCCDLTKNSLIRTSQQDYFSNYIAKMKLAHKDKYEYLDSFEKVSLKTKINILCKDHGIFVQDISHHLTRKQGCPVCGLVATGKSKSKSWVANLESLLAGIHLDETVSVISFENVKNSRDKITLSCSKHGIFEKSYGNLKLGQRCPECSIYEGWGKSTYIQRAKEMYKGLCNLYLIHCWNSEEDFYKIGITVHQDIRRRFAKSEMPYEYEVVTIILDDVEDVVNIETELHKEMSDFHYTPKIPFGGHVRECFSKDGINKAMNLFKNLKGEINE